MGLIRHKNKCQSPTKLKMIMIWVLGRRRRNKNEKKTPMLHTYLTAHPDNVSNTTQISHNTAMRIYRDKSCADDTPLCEGSGQGAALTRDGYRPACLIAAAIL